MKDINTEDKILRAAEDIFQIKGYEGARMQEIADHAKINKGLLHYYFRTKNKLFETIFSKAMGKMMIRMGDIMKGDLPFFEKLDAFVDNYMDLLLQNPYLPKFVLSELNRDPERFINATVAKLDVKSRISDYKAGIERAVSSGEVKPVDPKQLLISMISLCLFPFIGRPMIQVLFDLDDPAFGTLLEDRKDHIKAFIRNSIEQP